MPARDEYAIVLDFLPHGKPTEKRPEPIAQVIGEKFFNLLEVAVKEGFTLKPKDRIYIGEGERKEVKYVKCKIKYDQLTAFAKSTLEEILPELIEKNKERFINFFNRSLPITTRLHSLELLPGIGKKHLWRIIRERKKKPFESFEDLKKRVEMLPDPKRMIMKRILEELQEKDRHRLFVGTNFY